MSDWSARPFIEAEIEELRPLLAQHRERRQQLLQKLRDAKDAEEEAKEVLRLSRLSHKEKRARLRRTLQGAVAHMMAEHRAMKATHTPSPELHELEAKLDDSLKGLRHKIHGLKYSAEDREKGARRIQSWWRAVLAMRVRQLLRISRSLWELKRRMAEASVTIQKWYRAHITRLRWRAILDAALTQRRRSREALLEYQNKVVVVLQRAIRIYLAKKRLNSQEHGVEAVEDREETAFTKRYVDNWRPASGQREIRDGLPPEDLELAKMKDAGLIPFYSRCSSTIRHRIGGHFALKLQVQLGIGAGAGEQRALEDEKEPRALDDLGASWEIYPEGLTEGFLQSLSHVTKPQKRRRRLRPTKPQEMELSTQQRAELRVQQQEALEAQKRLEAVSHLQHPLLEGVALPNVPLHVRPPPPSAPPGRPRPNFGCGSLREECSWSDAKNFYNGGRRSETAREEPTSWRHL